MLVPSGPPGVQLRGEAHPLPVCLQPPLVPCRAPVSRRAYLPCLPLPRPILLTPDIINKTIKQYTDCYTTMKEANHENLEHFTAENFLKAVHMAISENMANEGPDRKKPRV